MRLQRQLPLIILLAALGVGSVATTAPAARAQTGERCFAETSYCIDGPIRDYWERNGGLPVFGYPISAQQVETVEDRTIPVQWFERDRLEIQAGGTVTAGRLGARYLELRGRPWQRFPAAEIPLNNLECRYFPETQHNACMFFLGYWEGNGGLERFGYPITEPLQEVIEGRTYTVQYFERRRLEYHPDYAGTPDVVQLGLLGSEVYGRNLPPLRP